MNAPSFTVETWPPRAEELAESRPSTEVDPQHVQWTVFFREPTLKNKQTHTKVDKNVEVNH